MVGLGLAPSRLVKEERILKGNLESLEKGEKPNKAHLENSLSQVQTQGPEASSKLMIKVVGGTGARVECLESRVNTVPGCWLKTTSECLCLALVATGSWMCGCVHLV